MRQPKLDNQRYEEFLRVKNCFVEEKREFIFAVDKRRIRQAFW